MVISVYVKQKKSEDITLWQAVLLGSPSTVFSVQDDEESPILQHRLDSCNEVVVSCKLIDLSDEPSMINSVICSSEVYKDNTSDAPSLETVLNMLSEVQDLTSA